MGEEEAGGCATLGSGILRDRQSRLAPTAPHACSESAFEVWAGVARG